MSSEDQKLQEYEKDYLKRLETKEEEPQDLQNLVFQMAKEEKKHEKKDYIGRCIACNKPVDRDELVFKNDHVFHPDCFDQHGSEFHAMTNLNREEKRAKIELVYFKNLKLRMSNPSSIKKSNPGSKKKSIKKKSSKRKPAKRTKRKTSKRRTKRKSSAKKRKPSRARRQVGKKRSRSKSRKRRR